MVFDKDVLKRFLKLTYGDRFHPRRAAFISVMMPVYGAVWGMDALGRKLDELRFPELDEVDVGEPIFIMAAPRSGTTLLHRLMSLDEQFTSFKLWQTMFPTVGAYDIAARLKWIDERLGHPMHKLQEAVAKQAFSGWEGIHKTRFDEAEEDEASFVLAMATPAVWLAAPYVNELPDVAYPDQTAMRDTLARYFRGTVKRHMLAEARSGGKDKTLLLKNVLLAGRLGIVTDACPDARFVNVVRHPYRTMASLMSFFTTPWRFHSPDVAVDGPEAKAFAEIAMDYALTVHRFMQELPEERGITVYYKDLIEKPEELIYSIYDRFGLEASESYRVELRRVVKAQRKYSSVHQYTLEEFGLTEDHVYNRLREIFEAHDLPRHPSEDELL